MARYVSMWRFSYMVTSHLSDILEPPVMKQYVSCENRLGF